MYYIILEESIPIAWRSVLHRSVDRTTTKVFFIVFISLFFTPKLRYIHPKLKNIIIYFFYNHVINLKKYFVATGAASTEKG